MAPTDIFNLLSFDDAFVSKRGSKPCRLRHDNGDLTYCPAAFSRVPFCPSTFDKDPLATRLSMVLECDEELQQFASALDEWAVNYLACHSERIFKKQLTPDQIRVNYNGLLKQAPGYPPTLKCKMDLEGRREICCWDLNGERIEAPGDWRTVVVKPKLHFSHLWIMGAQYGIVVQLTDAQLKPSENAPGVRENPFK